MPSAGCTSEAAGGEGPCAEISRPPPPRALSRPGVRGVRAERGRAEPAGGAERGRAPSTSPGPTGPGQAGGHPGGPQHRPQTSPSPNRVRNRVAVCLPWKPALLSHLLAEISGRAGATSEREGLRGRRRSRSPCTDGAGAGRAAPSRPPGRLAEPAPRRRAAAAAGCGGRARPCQVAPLPRPASAAPGAPRERRRARRGTARGGGAARPDVLPAPRERLAVAAGFRVRVAAVPEGGAGAAGLGDTMALRWWWRCGASSRRAPPLGSLPRLRPPGPGSRAPPPPAPSAAVSAARRRAPGGHRE